MKVVKDAEHCILLNYFGLHSKFYLAVTVMTYFDLADPGNPLKEQDMWPFVQAELGKDAVLDMAMPKPKAEVLIWGRCFTPDGTPRVASRVELAIGPVKKTLYVFGERYWKKAAGAGVIISGPEPFTQMPLTYDRAFGGRDFENNPTGRGAAPVLLPSGAEAQPLPNIEDPDHLIGSPSDRPNPAGLAPLDHTWPQRAKKLGTYDKKWFDEKWPFYPDDMNWTYFNTAPEDQQIDDFFAGTEVFSIAGMHPKEPVIHSRLPGIHHRFFINQLENTAKPEGEAVFKEVLAHIDTVWIFPHAKKGIAISRGTAEIKDDEALDVPHLYIVSERIGEDPGSMERYYEQFKKRIDRAIDFDIQPQMEEAKKKLTELADKLKDLPHEINDEIAQHLGQAPKPVVTPVEVVTRSIDIIDRQKKLLADGEKQVLALKETYGHMMKIDTGGFATAAKKLDEARTKLLSMPGKIEAITKKQAGQLEKFRKDLREMYPAELRKLEGGDVDFDAIIDMYKEKPGDPWHESGMRFIEKCRDDLIKDPEMMAAFRGTGLRPYTLKRSWIGINRQEARLERAAWGLKNADKGSHPDVLVIPAGLVIPHFEGAALKHITVRALPRGDVPMNPNRLLGAVMANETDVFVEGSSETAMVLDPDENKAFIVVRNEMEGLLLRQELGGDLCSIITMKDPSVKPAKDAMAALEKSPQFLVVFPSAGKSGPYDDISLWQKLAPHAEPLPLSGEKDLFEAKRSAVDIWQWVIDALRPNLKPAAETKPKDVDVMEPGAVAALIPKIDVEALLKKIKGALASEVKPGLDLMEAKEKEALGAARKELEKRGLNLDDLMKQTGKDIPQGANPYAYLQEEYKKDFAQLREKLTAKGVMSPDAEKKIGDLEKTAQKVLADSAKRFDDGTKRLEQATAKAEGPRPDWSRKLLEKAGFDPDDPTPLKPLTRDAVIDRHARGLSLSGKNMAGADLSGLDLAGANLRQANLQKANLTGVVLDGADLRSAIAGECDFSGASLKGANMFQGIFQKAKFPRADLSGADMTQAIMSESDLTEANLAGSTLVTTLLEKATLKNARAAGANASQIYLLSAEMAKADFTGAELTKAVLYKTGIDQVNFSRSTLREATIVETKGEEVNFSGADMHNSRILQGSAITGSDFTHTHADRASWMKSDLSGSDFRGMTIERGLLEQCDLTGSDFSGVKAKQARLTKSNLSDSNLRQINLFQGSLRKSKLVRTDLEKANLYGAEFYRTGVGETKLDGANLKMTKLHKRTDLIPEGPKEKKK